MAIKAQNWNLTPKQAIEVQKALREKVDITPLTGKVRTIAGADVSLNMFGKDLYAGIVVFSYPELERIEYALVKVKVSFPYIPGLLSFREVPGLLECLSKLKNRPDLIMVDGQGIAHPRRLGIATHLGLVTGIPTIGCAKSRLYGVHNEPLRVGSAKRLLDPYTGDVLGYALKSKTGSKPLIISPGHGISAEESLEIVKSTLRGYRLPEPTKAAHELVNRFRKGEIE
jgi:deoxyribonuclease V